MANLQQPKPGILPPNSPIVSNTALPHIPTETTDPNFIDQGANLNQQDPSGAGVAGATPQVSEARQNLSGALLELAGTFIGNALEEGLGGDGTGRVAKGIEKFASAGAGILKERWYKENASNFNQMVFKPFENANKSAFEDYNNQMDVINADPNMAPEEKFAAGRALQYKLSMTGKNLNLQLQMAAANPQFQSNPYVKNTMATLLNHQEGVINDLSQAYTVALDSAKTVSGIQTDRANQERARLEGAAATAQKERFEQETRLAPAESKAKIDLQTAQAAQARDEGGMKRREALAKGDLSQAKSADEALAATDANLPVQERLDRVYKEKDLADSEQEITSRATKFQHKIEQEFSNWASTGKKKFDINNSAERPKAVVEFFNRTKLPLDSALRQFKDDPDTRMMYLAWLQYSGADPTLALAPMSDTANHLAPGRKGNPLWENYLKAQTRGNAEEAMETGKVHHTIAALEAGGRKDLADEVRTGQRGQAIGLYTPSKKLEAAITNARQDIQQAQQLLKDEMGTDKRPDIIQGYKITINNLMKKIEIWSQKLEEAKGYEE